MMIPFGSKIMLKTFQLQCEMHGFFKRGNAYFRVVGDGILQVIKATFESDCSDYSISIGLHSMYAELLPQWFTYSGCIPRYCITSILNDNGSVHTNSSKAFPGMNRGSFHDQVLLLSEKIFMWLDQMHTQDELAQAICFLDVKTFHVTRWNDEQRIAPYLASRQYEKAKRVIDAILLQHATATQQLNFDEAEHSACWNKGDYKQYRALFPGTDEKYLLLLDLIQTNSHKAIDTFLQGNYEKNTKLASFCMR